MDENESSISSAEIGRYLMLMREQAGLTQAELAQRIFWNADTLSRVECGEHIIDLDQAQEILKLIDSNEALAVSKALTRSWDVLQRPPIDHPDQEILWEAEQVAADLQKLSQRPDTPHAFERRLSEYIEELKRCALLLLKRDHKVAFIGSIGIGKSTAICKMTGLEVPKEDGTLIPVLEVGGGGITVCEVHLRTGTEFGLLIEPRSEDEIRQDVGDLVDHIFRNSSQQDMGANESQGISKEVSRALRNMAQLSIVRKKNADGKSSILDPAKKLAEGCSNSRELVVEILSRME